LLANGRNGTGRRMEPPCQVYLGHDAGVELGLGVIVLPLSTATFCTRDDMTHIGIEDSDPSGSPWPGTALRNDLLVGEFVAIAAIRFTRSGYVIRVVHGCVDRLPIQLPN
jgi:hypothetical protein